MEVVKSLNEIKNTFCNGDTWCLVSNSFATAAITGVRARIFQPLYTVLDRTDSVKLSYVSVGYMFF
jgi:hypothetical protein